MAEPEYPRAIGFEDYDAQAAVREANPIDEGFARALKGFSLATASLVLKDKSKNANYSPISLYMALALAATGAGGETRDEMLSAMGAGRQQVDFVSTQTGNLFRRLYRDNEIGKLKLANSLWLQQARQFRSDFVSNAQDNFYASLHCVDFAKPEAGRLMGEWIAKNTNGLLTPKISTDPAQIMSIIHTVYFRDEWVDKFNEGATKPDTFKLGDGGEVTCDFMNAVYGSHAFARGEGFTRSGLGLKSAGEMVFILPDPGVSVSELLSTPERTAALFADGEEGFGKVTFQIPKFAFNSDLNLNEALRALGVRQAFEPDADFSAMVDGQAFISDVKQQTRIAVNENGVEAAAFTQIDYMGAAMPTDEAEMILDRPFVFAITANTGDILFIGIVNDPTEK